jgi:hypothetical protein
MKHAVSISLGSSKRDKKIELELLGQRVCVERIGMDGDMRRAAQLFRELDGKVDALGVGGADLGLLVAGRWYPLHGVKAMVRGVRRTPVVDGTGLKTTLERRVAAFMDAHLRAEIAPRRVLFTLGGDRWGMAVGFIEAGYEYIFGDLGFALGLPVAIRSVDRAVRLYRWLLPVIAQLPFEWLYPIGEKQERREPKFAEWYRWATVIAGDCHYIKRHMPTDLAGKIICTNTTTPADVEAFRAAGARALVTTTPVIEGRSFGTNALEAALIAAKGKARTLTFEELEELIDELGLQPSIQSLSP